MKSDATEIFLAGVEAAKPKNVIPEFFLKNQTLEERIQKVVKSKKRIFLFSLGKAAYALAEEFTRRYEAYSCFIYTKENHIPKENHLKSKKMFLFREGSHPLPSQKNVEITKEVVEWMEAIDTDATLIVLLSGGGSALLEWPLEPFQIEDIIRANETFLSSPMSIGSINEERKKLSRVKGGKLLSFLSPEVNVITLALSDVLSDDPDVIASAPTYPGSEYYIIGNLKKSLLAAQEKARSLHYHTLIYSDQWQEDAKLTGKKIAESIRDGNWNSLLRRHGKIAILIGGEMVASVKLGGMGGRNQEASLSFAYYADKFQLNHYCFLAAGTDGTDGPTSVAGACIGPESLKKIKQSGMDPLPYLENSNSYPILKEMEAHIITGPTGTNVNDLIILLLDT